jgi:ATP-dependent helicase/DNAse subunit B
MAQVRLLCGAQRSARSSHIDALMREHWGHALLLVPTRRYAACRAEPIILDGNLDGAWGRPVLTFDDFAATLLRAEGLNPVRLQDTERRLLLERAVERVRQSPALRALGAAAKTSGFLSHMLRVITQLKQAAIEPDDFRRRAETRSHPTPLDAVVSEVYAAYQAALREARVYDLPGLFWEADALCRTRRPAAIEGVAALLLDDFDDFTPSEFRLLTSLAGHVDLLVFGLDYDPDPGLQDLYAMTKRTAEKIQNHFAAVTVVFEEPPPQSFTEFAARNIFWRDRPRLLSGLRPDLEVVSCPDFVQEVETIGRRVKALLLDEGVPVESVAVVYRNLRDAAGTVRSVLGEFGIPVRVAQDPALWESAIGAFLMSVFDAMDSWGHEAVVDVLTSPWFVTEHRFVDTAPFLARMAQVVSGREEWRRRVENLIARLDTGAGEDVERLFERMPHARQAAAALLARVDALEELERLVPAKATPEAFAAAVDHLIDAVGVERTLEAQPAAIRDFERAALDALRDLLGTWRVWHGPEALAQTRAEFVASFRHALQETAFTPPQPRYGVACLDAASVRHLRFDYVFFGGANEGEVPQAPPSSAIYSDEDIEGLARAGIVIEGRRAHIEREALLFHHVIEAPRTHLCITWHARSRRGQEQFPSPYVVELTELFPNAIIRKAAPGQGVTPPLDQAASWRDLRNIAFSTVPGLRTAFPEPFHRARIGAEIESQRHDRTPFGRYDGVLGDGRLIESIAATFGGRHCFSVQQIETYTACPFRFFVERVLGLEAVEIPVAEFDPRVRGTILHAILEAFHEHYRGQAVPEIPEEEAREFMRELVVREFHGKAWRSATAPPGVGAVERARLLAILERYLRIERDRDESSWKPSHFEIAFGDARHTSRDPVSTANPFPLTTPIGPVPFSGRIDRMDRAGETVRILDYKSSQTPDDKDIREGRSIQLTIYALAVEEFLMSGVRCLDAYFLPVGRKKRIEGLKRNKKTDAWSERQTVARETVGRCVAAVRAGVFPPTPTDDVCGYCPAGRACRFEPGRIERKGARS